MQGKEHQMKYWHQAAIRTLETADDLYRLKHRDACLFFGHLALEKLLKGLIVKRTKDFPPLIHDLAKLAKIGKIELEEKYIQELRTITTFNISGRYDDVKFAFYKKCTPAFTKKYLDLTKKLFLWFEKEYQKK